MRPPGWFCGVARQWPLLLAALAVASLAGVPFTPRPAPSPPASDPLELLRRGLRALQTGEGDPLVPLEEGLSRIRRPAELGGFDLPTLRAALRAAAERETEAGRLARLAGIAVEIGRFVPESPAESLELGDLWRRAGRPWEAAHAWAAAARRVEPAGVVRPLREAAETLFRDGFFLPAADLFAELSARIPSDTESLFRRAESLMRAGLWEPDALEAFDVFLGRVGPGDPLVPRALLVRGTLLADLGRVDEALRDFDRLLRDPSLGIDPRTEEWSEALRRRGGVLLAEAEAAPSPRREVLRREARQALEEYLERYAAEGPLGPLATGAAIGLVRARLAENEWAEALAHLEGILSRLPSPLHEDLLGPVLELRLLRGEILLLLGRLEESAAAFGEAARRSGADPARLGGLLGKARALLRLGRREEARLEVERARAVYESEVSLPGAVLAGSCREFWRGEFEAVAREFP